MLQTALIISLVAIAILIIICLFLATLLIQQENEITDMKQKIESKDLALHNLKFRELKAKELRRRFEDESA